MASLPIMIVLSGGVCIFIVLSSSTSLAKITESKSSSFNGTELAFFPSASSNLRGSNDNCSNCPANAFCAKTSDSQFCLCKFGYDDHFDEDIKWSCKKINCTNDTDCAHGLNSYCTKEHECHCNPDFELNDENPLSCHLMRTHSEPGLGVGIYVLIGIVVLMVVALFVYILIASIPYCTNTNVQAPNYEALKGANYRRNPHYLQEQLPQDNTESQLENDGSEEVAAEATGQKQVSLVGSTGGKAKSRYTKQGFEALLYYYRSV